MHVGLHSVVEPRSSLTRHVQECATINQTERHSSFTTELALNVLQFARLLTSTPTRTASHLAYLYPSSEAVSWTYRPGVSMKGGRIREQRAEMYQIFVSAVAGNERPICDFCALSIQSCPLHLQYAPGHPLVL